MKYKEFDYYASAVVEREGLKSDTALWAQEAYYLQDIISKKDNQIANYEKVMLNNDSLFKEFDDSFKKLSKDYQKLQKKHKRSKSVALMLTGISCVLGLIVLIK